MLASRLVLMRSGTSRRGKASSVTQLAPEVLWGFVDEQVLFLYLSPWAVSTVHYYDHSTGSIWSIVCVPCRLSGGRPGGQCRQAEPR